jgi:stage III sporulation protein AD
MILIKALGVAILAQMASSICEDSGNKTLSFGVDLAGRVVILALCIPMIRAITKFAFEIIKGN